MGCVEGHEVDIFSIKEEIDSSESAMTVFGDDEIGDIGWFIAFFALVVIIGAVEKSDEVSVLLD